LLRITCYHRFYVKFAWMRHSYWALPRQNHFETIEFHSCCAQPMNLIHHLFCIINAAYCKVSPHFVWWEKKKNTCDQAHGQWPWEHRCESRCPLSRVSVSLSVHTIPSRNKWNIPPFAAVEAIVNAALSKLVHTCTGCICFMERKTNRKHEGSSTCITVLITR
jgi:hypothetical protein